MVPVGRRRLRTLAHGVRRCQGAPPQPCAGTAWCTSPPDAQRPRLV